MSRARDFADLASAYSQDSLGKRNLLYNGDMSVAQRGTSKTGYAHDTSGYYFTSDRWAIDVGGSTGGVFTLTQDTDSTAPFPEAYKIACTTADTSIAAGEYAILSQALEGRDLARIRKGNSDAKKLTVSFWCKADASLTYGISLRDDDNDRICNSTFNVTTSWNRVSVTFPADTNGEYLNHDNNTSMTLYIWLHAGSTYTGGTFSSLTWADTVWNTAVSSIGSIYASTSRTFYITGVQMETGEVATPFEHESYADNLARCQRYYYVLANGANQPMGTGSWYASTEIDWFAKTPVTMRAIPSLEVATGTNYYRSIGSNTYDDFNGVALASDKSVEGVYLYATTGTHGASGTQGDASIVTALNASAKVALIAEL